MKLLGVLLLSPPFEAESVGPPGSVTMEYQLSPTRTHYELSSERAHYQLSGSRMHYETEET